MPLRLRAPRQLRAGANTDATWGSDHNDRKSINGDLVHIDRALVDYGSTKQMGIVQSSTEAELVSGAKGGMKVKFMEHVMDEVLGEGVRVEPSFWMVDNEGAIHVVNNNAVTPNTKHIDIKTRYLQLEVQEERLEVQHVRTEECHADIETKNLPDVAHAKHSKAIHNGVFTYIEDMTVSSMGGVRIDGMVKGCWSSHAKEYDVIRQVGHEGLTVGPTLGAQFDESEARIKGQDWTEEETSLDMSRSEEIVDMKLRV